MAETEAPRGRGRRFGMFVLRSVSPLVAAAGLAGVAYFGHRTGWAFGLDAPPADAPAAEPAAVWVEAGVVRFASAAVADRLGVEAVPAWPAAIAETASGPAETAFDPARVARVAPRVGGVVVKVHKAVGDVVVVNDELAAVDSAAAGKAVSDLRAGELRATTLRQAHEYLVANPAGVTGATLREVAAAARDAAAAKLAAEQAVWNLGRTPADAGPDFRVTLRSPAAGMLLSADLVAGELADPARVAFVVADAAVLRVTAFVSSAAAARMTPGMRVAFRPDGGPADFPGIVTGVAAAADAGTRTVAVRADVPNPAGTLRANVRGVAKVTLRESPAAITVPAAAVHTLDDRTVVFVRDAGGGAIYHVRVVETGGRDGDVVEIRTGLAAGELVAAAGGNLMLDEVRKTRPDP